MRLVFCNYRDRENENKNAIRWECQMVCKFRCPARVTSVAGEIVRRSKRDHAVHVGASIAVLLYAKQRGLSFAGCSGCVTKITTRKENH